MNERQRILHRIDRLENQRCKKCDSHNYNAADIHCKCHAATEIRKLGEQLIGLTAKRRKGALDVKVQRIRKQGLTLESYRELRETELSNQQIMKAVGISEPKFYEWKARALGGSPTPPQLKPQLAKEAKERKKWREVAEKNGIQYKTFAARLKRGDSYEKAATAPVRGAK